MAHPTENNDWRAISGLVQNVTRIGRNLKTLRTEAKLSRKGLSDRTREHHPNKRSVSPRRISQIEKGLGNPDLAELQLLCLALERRLREIVRSEFPIFAANALGKGKDGINRLTCLRAIEATDTTQESFEF